MMIRLLLLALLGGGLLSTPAFSQRYTKWVDPFLGTGGHGHTYPGATTPFGMVQLSPDNGTEGWDWCSGYHYSSDSIAGFSHTHLNGTGIGDWCDISFQPLKDTTGADERFMKHAFQHSNEKAFPGYYRVRLNNGISCELAASSHCGLQRYQFGQGTRWMRIDLGFHINWDKTTAAFIQIINDSTVVGYRYSTGWAKNQRVYFAARFNQPIRFSRFIGASKASLREAEGNDLKLLLQLGGKEESVLIRTGISSVSSEKALQALGEIRDKAFDQVVKEAEAAWEKELRRIQIDTSDRAFATRFYTALYRTCLSPSLYSDADGTYRNQDNRVYQMPAGQARYTIFSLWDTFRALNPLYTLTQPKRLPDMINSMLRFYDENGLLPVWDISTWEANTMTGYHAIPVLADAILKNLGGFDVEKAYTAMRKSAFQQQRGTPDYIKYGYLPQDKHGWSVTITLEYAFDDWCIAQVARKLGKMDDYTMFMNRSKSYRPLFDAATGFMRAKNSRGEFLPNFDPLLSEHGFDGQYIEGTAWQHSFFVPHDVQGFAELMGGKNQLVKKLDDLFSAPSELHGENTSVDVTGLIGQYAHGNEPSHHIIYMYSALGHREKAAKWIKVVADSMYKNGPDGLTGNDDCGQMSAWYIWTSLGMYPMNPASGEYVVGYPLVDQATLLLPNGKQLKIRTIGRRHPGDFVQKVLLNGKLVTAVHITHAQLLAGGELIYVLK
ncbi:MAG: GH92 family glycosyl hydrolase [Sediminibacterium sp.]|jgi:predicted alpha-1,2-mannosidase